MVRLRALVQEAAEKKKPLHFDDVKGLINDAPLEERAEAAADAEGVMFDAIGGVDDDSYASFVAALGVRVKSKVHTLKDAKVDEAIQGVLDGWVSVPAKKGVTVQGHVVVLTTGQLKKAAKQYAASLPGGGQINAFTEDGTIFLGATSGVLTTVVHEGIHLYASGVVKKLLGGGFDEGVTEYFARLVATKAFGAERDAYAVEHKVASFVIGKLSEEAMATAYFAGVPEPLEKAFNEAKVKGDWKSFAEALESKSWDEASQMLG